MTSQKEHWYNNPWILVLGTTILAPLGSVFFDLIKQIPFLTTIKIWWIWIQSIVNLELKLWWVLVWVLATSLIKAIQIRIKNRKLLKDIIDSEHSKSIKNFLNYKTDILIKWTWEWKWQKSMNNNTYNIVNLIPLCPTCKTIMPKKPFDITYRCPRCNYISSQNSNSSYEKRTNIETLILDNIKKDNYPTSPST